MSSDNIQRTAEVFQASTPSMAFGNNGEHLRWFLVNRPVGGAAAPGHVQSSTERFQRGMRARDARRVRTLRKKILKQATHKRRVDAQEAQAADVLGMLTSFETSDALARGGQTDNQIIATLKSLAQTALPLFVSSIPAPRSASDMHGRRKSRA
jgi:hypothetical protein